MSSNFEIAEVQNFASTKANKESEATKEKVAKEKEKEKEKAAKEKERIAKEKEKEKEKAAKLKEQQKKLKEKEKLAKEKAKQQELQKKEKEKKEEENNKPTRARTAYIFFYSDALPTLKKQNPDLKTPDLTIKVAEQWKALSSEQKQVLFFFLQKLTVSSSISPHVSPP